MLCVEPGWEVTVYCRSISGIVLVAIVAVVVVG